MKQVTIAFKVETDRGTTYEECLKPAAGTYYNAEDGPSESRGGSSWIRVYTPCLIRDGIPLPPEEAVSIGMVKATQQQRGSREWTVYQWAD